MPADLRDLLDRTAAEPTTPADPAAIRARSRRRTWRQRGGAGATAVVFVALFAAIAWPGAAPLGILVEDRVAGQPEDSPLDLPDGWRPVEVGDAVFGVPPELAPIPVGREEPVPCVNSVDEPTAFLATSGYPRGDQACRLVLTTTPALLAAPLDTVPDRELEPGEGPWEVAPSGGPLNDLDPTVEVRVDAQEPLLQRAYRFPELNLYLSISGADTHDHAILDTVTPRGDATR